VNGVLPLLAVGLPLAGVGVAALGRFSSGRVKQRWLAAVMLTTLLVALALARAVLADQTPTVALWRMTPQLWLALRVDAAGALYGATVALLALLALIYSFAYIRPSPQRWRYFAFLQACVACNLGVAYAGDLLTLLVFYEAFSVLSYVLIVHEQTPAALAAGFRYIAFILLGGGALLAGVLLAFFAAGDLSFRAGGFLPGDASLVLLQATFWCLVLGFGVKAALVPLHGWVPEAHPAAPAPFSALLSGVMVAAGAFGILRVLYDVFGVTLLASLGSSVAVLSGLALVSALFGALLALRQDDLKRRLAYSTISQMGTLTLAASLLAPGPLIAALVHLVHHAFLKGTLFFAVGVWIHASGRRRLSELPGVGARLPLATAAFALAALGMIGLPPLSGFVSKWWLGVGMLEAGAWLPFAVLLVGALLSAGYLLPVLYAAYFAPVSVAAADVPPRRQEASLALLLPTLVAAAMTLLLGFGAQLPGFPLELARRAAADWLGPS
jgi:multicomponent Na+:H+ antiporter subunit D